MRALACGRRQVRHTHARPQSQAMPHQRSLSWQETASVDDRGIRSEADLPSVRAQEPERLVPRLAMRARQAARDLGDAALEDEGDGNAAGFGWVGRPVGLVVGVGGAAFRGGCSRADAPPNGPPASRHWSGAARQPGRPSNRRRHGGGRRIVVPAKPRSHTRRQRRSIEFRGSARSSARRRQRCGI